jgi:MinD superfamily P-loop ATPase
MKIAVLSGKGGTGKTLVSVNLAAAANEAVYVDCDVEEPNGHLFFKPELIDSQSVCVRIPAVNDRLCSGCRQCIDTCKFNALAYIGGKIAVFEDICHSCGGCVLLCPKGALFEYDKVIGEIQEGASGNVTVLSGILNTGEASGVQIIKKLLDRAKERDTLTFIDCPPGSACIVMASIKDADYCVLVAEPTIFGSHNLKMVYELVQLFGKPHGVVLNKCLDGENPSEKFCMENGIKILARIPFDIQLGLINSNALIAARESVEYNAMFSGLLGTVTGEVLHETAVDS